MNPDGPERRREPGWGRREEDYIYHELARRLERLDDELAAAIEKLKDQIDQLEKAINDQIKELDKAINERIKELEIFHITDQAETRIRAAERSNKVQEQQSDLNRWQRVAIFVGFIVAMCAVGSLVVSIIVLLTQ